MAWLTLTAPNGDPVQLSGDQLVRIRIPLGGDTAPDAKAIVDLTNGQSQATKETPDQIMALMAGKAEPARLVTRRTK